MSNDGEELSRSHQLQIEKRKTTLPGQGLALQFPVSSLGPLQSNPPLAGGGLVQVLNLVRFPPPHVTLQEPQSSHSLHEPLTEIINDKKHQITNIFSNLLKLMFQKAISICQNIYLDSLSSYIS